MPCGIEAMGLWRRSVGHAEVGADDIQDGLSLFGVRLSEPFKRVESAETNGSSVRAELIDSFDVELGDTTFVVVVVAGVCEALLMSMVNGREILLVGLSTFLQPLA